MTYRKTDKTEERKDEKRRLLFDTAAKVFAQRGYHATAVKDITDEAGISVGTFYLYFKNKEDLFEKLYDDMAAMIQGVNAYAVDGGNPHRSVEERFSRAVASSLWAYEKHNALARIMLIEAVGLNPRFEEKYAEITGASAEEMEKTLSRLQAQGLVNVPDTKVAALAYQGAAGCVAYWLRTGEGADMRLHAYPLAVFLLQALKIAFADEDVQRHVGELFRELDCGLDQH